VGTGFPKRSCSNKKLERDARLTAGHDVFQKYEPHVRLRPHQRCGKDRPAFKALDASMCAGAADGTALKLAAVAQW
jgi:hypothetical protein